MKCQTPMMAALSQLQSSATYPAVTIQLTLARTMPEKMQDRIRLKDLIAQAKTVLQQQVAEKDTQVIIEQLESMAAEYDFSHSQLGLIVFATTSFTTYLPLPFPLKPSVSVARSFYIADAVRQELDSLHYWILELRSDISRLYEAYNDALHEIVTPVIDEQGNPLQGFPLDYIKPEPAVTAAVGVGDRDARYLEDHRKHYFHMVDNELHKKLNELSLPVIVVATQEEGALFKGLTKQSDYIVGYQHGDYRTPFDLSKAVSPIIEKYHRTRHEKKLQEFIEAAGQLHQAFGIRRVWLTAHEGRVYDLLVEKDLVIPGKLDEQNPHHLWLLEGQKVVGDMVNLVDVLIARVLETHGCIWFFEPGTLKDFEHIGAILRY